MIMLLEIVIFSIPIISVIISLYTIFMLRTLPALHPLSLQDKYVDFKYGYSILEAETGFHTQFSFSNRGTIHATEAKIILTYPPGTQITKISPPIKYTESEDSLKKLIELHIKRLNADDKRLNADASLGVFVTSSHEFITPPKILCHEQESVRVETT